MVGLGTDLKRNQLQTNQTLGSIIYTTIFQEPRGFSFVNKLTMLGGH